MWPSTQDKSDLYGRGCLGSGDFLSGSSAHSGLRVIGVRSQYHCSFFIHVWSSVDSVTRRKFEAHSLHIRSAHSVGKVGANEVILYVYNSREGGYHGLTVTPFTFFIHISFTYNSHLPLSVNYFNCRCMSEFVSRISKMRRLSEQNVRYSA